VHKKHKKSIDCWSLVAGLLRNLLYSTSQQVWSRDRGKFSTRAYDVMTSAKWKLLSSLVPSPSCPRITTAR